MRASGVAVGFGWRVAVGEIVATCVGVDDGRINRVGYGSGEGVGSGREGEQAEQERQSARRVMPTQDCADRLIAMSRREVGQGVEPQVS